MCSLEHVTNAASLAAHSPGVARWHAWSAFACLRQCIRVERSAVAWEISSPSSAGGGDGGGDGGGGDGGGDMGGGGGGGIAAKSGGEGEGGGDRGAGVGDRGGGGRRALGKGGGGGGRWGARRPRVGEAVLEQRVGLVTV